MTTYSEASQTRAPATKYFDLRSCREHGFTVKSYLRGLSLLLIILPLAGLGWYFETIPIGILLLTPEVLVVGMLCAMCVIGVYLTLGLAPGASACEVDDLGFTLHFARGHKLRLEWASPAPSVRVSEVVVGDSPSYELRVGLPFTNDITPELYHELLDSARRSNMTIRTRSTSGIGTRVVSNQIVSRRARLQE